MRSASALAIASTLAIGLLPAAPRAQAPQPAAAAADAACALSWSGHETELEQFLKSAKVANMKAVPVGVTRPSRWEVTATATEAGVTGKAVTQFRFADFNMTKPRVAVVLSVKDDIRLEYVCTLVRGSP